MAAQAKPDSGMARKSRGLEDEIMRDPDEIETLIDSICSDVDLRDGCVEPPGKGRLQGGVGGERFGDKLRGRELDPIL